MLAALRDLSGDLPALGPAVDRLAARLEALDARGVDVDSLPFETSHGRTTMEYYDGFVFAVHAEGRSDLPPVATGGRYDALTRQLGRGDEIPAVGGVLRPDLMLVPHHGAATTDPDWLRETAGPVAVISVGPNSYGHPDEGIVAVLAEAGSRVLTTMEHGDIAVPMR